MKSLKNILLLAGLVLAFGISALAQNVDVNPGAGTYPTLADACTAINAGTHTGAVVVDIKANTTETAACVINSSGAGAASYTSINIRPTVDGVTVSGAGAGGGRGLIELNGADNVTIDGDNPNTAGTNRNLTINDTSIGTFHSVIRIALATTIVTSADNNSFKNLVLIGGAVGRNIAAATSTAGTENTTYGVLVTGGASTVAATTAPSTIASTTTTIGTGATAANLIIDNNTVTNVARAIAVQGSATTVAPGLQITRNVIGNPASLAADGVYSIGITAQGSANGIIRANTVYVESFLGTQIRGIDNGSINANGTFTIEKNIVSRVNNRSTGTFGAYGISLNGGNGSTVRNNFVSGVQHDMTGGGAFSTTFGVFGIRIGSGTGHFIYNNSVNLASAYTGTPATSLLSAAFAITSTALTGIDARNNIFSNTNSGGTTSIAHVSIYLPSGGTSAMNLTLNNNDYRFGTDTARQGAGQAGTTAGTNFFTTFDPTMTTPASNLRSYTNTLNAAGNDTASVSVDPAFNSATDLHVLGTSPVLNIGATIASVTDDIDGDARPIEGAYDIGADERMTAVAPGQIQLSSAAYGGNEGTTATVTATRTMGTSGAVTVNYATSDGTAIGGASCGAGADYVSTAGTLSWANGEGGAKTFTIMLCTDAVTDPSETVNITLSMPTGGTTLGIPNTAILTITDVPPPFNGTYTVGTSGNYSSLTNAGGLFEALNLAGASGPVTINVTSDLTGETGAVALNEIAGGFTVLIRPSGGARQISGTSATATPVRALIRINGADNVTINGSLIGTGNDRSLTVTNADTATTSGVIHFSTGTNGAQNDTIRNVIVIGSSPTAGTLTGISFGGNTAVNSLGADNDNKRIINCDIRRVLWGILSLGASTTNKDTGAVIANNALNNTAPDNIGQLGIGTAFDDGTQIVANNIGGIVSAGSVDSIGISLGGLVGVSTATVTGGSETTNAIVSRNNIGTIQNTNTFSAFGILIAPAVTGTNRIDNNMISGVGANATSGDFSAGIFLIDSGTDSTTQLYYNSVSMSGTFTGGDEFSYALAINGTDPAVVSRNNIFVNTQVNGTATNSYATGLGYTTFANFDSNYNDLFVTSGATFFVGRTGSVDNTGTATNYAALAAYQTAVADEANSIIG